MSIPISELADVELRAFMALLKMLIRADGEFSEVEMDHMAALGDAIGEERWQREFAAVKGQFKKPSDISTLAAMVIRPDARKVIHATLTRVANGDGMDDAEAKLLDALATLWTLVKPRGARRRRGLT